MRLGREPQRHESNGAAEAVVHSSTSSARDKSDASKNHFIYLSIGTINMRSARS